MNEKRDWTAEELEMLEMFRSTDEAAVDPALASTLEAVKQDPELSERLDRILAWDERISTAMRDVPAPPALAEQILQAVDTSSDQPRPASRLPRVKSGRRRLLAGAIAVGLAAALLVAVTLGRSLPTMTPGALRSMARDRFAENQDSEPVGTSLAQSLPSDRFRYSPDLRGGDGVLWRSIPPFDRAEAVAYDIPIAPGQKATLYVVRCRSDAPLPPRPPRKPQLRTQGLAITAWQGNGVVYVAVVEGSGQFSAEAAYDYLLRSSAQPLT